MQKTQPEKYIYQTQKMGFSQVSTIISDLLFGFILLCLKYFHEESLPWTALFYSLNITFYVQALTILKWISGGTFAWLLSFQLPSFPFSFIPFGYCGQKPCSAHHM